MSPRSPSEYLPRRQAVEDYVYAHPEGSPAGTIRYRLGLTKDQVKNALRYLQKAGLVDRRDGRWYPTVGP